MGPADNGIPRQVHKGVNQQPGLGCSKEVLHVGHKGMGPADHKIPGQVDEEVNQQLQHPGEELK